MKSTTRKTLAKSFRLSPETLKERAALQKRGVSDQEAVLVGLLLLRAGDTAAALRGAGERRGAVKRGVRPKEGAKPPKVEHKMLALPPCLANEVAQLKGQAKGAPGAVVIEAVFHLAAEYYAANPGLTTLALHFPVSKADTQSFACTLAALTELLTTPGVRAATTPAEDDGEDGDAMADDNAPAEDNTHRGVLRRKARAIVSQIVQVTITAKKAGAPEATVARLTRAYYAALDRLFDEELPAAAELGASMAPGAEKTAGA